jgi:HNH endonuclease
VALAQTTTEKKAYAPVSRCIYCGTAENLSAEHIIPWSLGGRLELPKASCSACAGETHAFEGECLGRMFIQGRAQLGNRSRKRGVRTSLPVEVDHGSHVETREVSIHILPGFIIMFHFRMPGALLNMPPTVDLSGPIVLCATNPEFKNTLPANTRLTKPFSAMAFGRLLAKIAHSYTVAERGFGSFTALLPDIILGKGPLMLNSFVGSGITIAPSSQKLHELSLSESWTAPSGKPLLVCSIRLFSNLAMPTHYVVFGHRPLCRASKTGRDPLQFGGT